MGWNLTSRKCWILHNAGHKYKLAEEELESSSAEKDLGWWSASGWIGISRVPKQPRGKITSWSASNSTTSCSKWSLSCCIQHWCSLSWRTVGSSGPHNLIRMWKSLNASRGGQQRWWQGWESCPEKSSWGLWACQVWRGGGWGLTSLLSIWKGEVERKVLSLLPGIYWQDRWEWFKATQWHSIYYLLMLTFFQFHSLLEPL